MDIVLADNLLDVISDAGFTVEWIDCKTGRFLKVNQYSAVMHGMPISEIEGKFLWEIDPVFTKETFDEFVEMLRGCQRFCLETEHVRHNGERFPIEVTVSYRGEEKGLPEHFIAFVKDISERKKMEAILLQKNAELEEFTYRTSHDLRSPLSSSIQLIKMSQNLLDKGDIEKTKVSLDHVDLSLQKLEQLINDILELTKAQNKQELIREVSIEKMVEDALFKLEHMPDFENLRIEKDIQIDDQIYTQPSRLNLIIENTISNAIKYHDKDEDQSICQIVARIDWDDFIYEVIDNGLGVPEDLREKMFQMFQRFHPDAAQGSGLGLYMMKKSAEILGGDFEYEARAKGSIFRLRIPMDALRQG